MPQYKLEDCEGVIVITGTHAYLNIKLPDGRWITFNSDVGPIRKLHESGEKMQ